MKVNSLGTSIIATIVVPTVFFFISFLVFPNFSKQFFGVSSKDSKNSEETKKEIQKNDEILEQLENTTIEISEGIKNTTQHIQNIYKYTGVEDRLKRLFPQKEYQNDISNVK